MQQMMASYMVLLRHPLYDLARRQESLMLSGFSDLRFGPLQNSLLHDSCCGVPLYDLARRQKSYMLNGFSVLCFGPLQLTASFIVLVAIFPLYDLAGRQEPYVHQMARVMCCYGKLWVTLSGILILIRY